MSFPFTVPLSPKEVLTPTVAQRCPLGTRGQTADGRVYRYAKAGSTTLVKGLLVQAVAATTTWENATLAYFSTGFLATLGTTYIPTGTTFVDLSATHSSGLTVAADFFKEGWFWVSGTATCGGQMMKVKTQAYAASSNSTGLCSTGGKLRLMFEEGYTFSEPADTDAEVSVMKNLYDSVIVAIANPTAAVLGVPNCNVTGGYYFWLQTWGACAIKSDTTVAFATNKYLINSSWLGGYINGATNATGWISRGVYEQNQIAVGVGMQSTAVSVLQASTFPLVNLTLAP